MGGEGSGRRVDATKQALNLLGFNQPAKTGDDMLYLPNLSGVMNEVRKDSPLGWTVGSVIFVGSDGKFAQDNANLFWDDTNNRLGIGTSAPNVLLEAGTSGTVNSYTFYHGATGVFKVARTTTQYTSLEGNASWNQITFAGKNSRIVASGAATYFDIYVNDTTQSMVFNPNGNVGVGTDPGTAAKLDILGTTRMGTGHTAATEELEIQGADDTVLKIYSKGARVDANTPTARLYLNKDITSGTVTAQDVAGLILVNSDDASNNLGNSHQILFQTSAVVAGSVTSDVVFQTVNNTNIGTLSEALRIQGSKVGIGTTTPDSILHISGGSIVSNKTTAPTLVTGSGAFFISGGSTNTVEAWLLGYNGTQVRLGVA